jgi:hypothetical protein
MDGTLMFTGLLISNLESLVDHIFEVHDHTHNCSRCGRHFFCSDTLLYCGIPLTFEDSEKLCPNCQAISDDEGL